MRSTTRRRERLTPFAFDRFGSGESRYVSATFGKLGEARDAVRALEEIGYSAHELSVVMTDEVRRHHLRTHPEFEGFDPESLLVDQVEVEHDTKALKGVGTGGAIGAALGAVTAALAATAGAIVIPALGVVIAGPLAAAFAGAGAGSAVGGLVGGLTGAGMSEYRAKQLERVISEGRIVVVARARTLGDLRQIEQAVLENGGVLVAEGPTTNA